LWDDASLSDLRLLRYAIRHDWPVPPERWLVMRDAIFARLDSENARRIIALGWVAIEAQGANLRARREALQARPGRR